MRKCPVMTDHNQQQPRKRYKRVHTKPVDTEEIVRNLKAGQLQALSKAITFVESKGDVYRPQAEEILQSILPFTGNSIRIGISGVPGAGKSTFIENLGLFLCELGYKVAVLAIDPSSSISGGSILGDKTRMEELSKHPNAFIRPTPSGGKLGGVHRKTRESMMICEAAGYSVILVETVGVGQSEAEVRDMVDFFLLLTLTGAGDELQGMKKGILELVDGIAVNKADGENEKLAIRAKEEYRQILRDHIPATKDWTVKTFTCSALHKKGLNEIWEAIIEFSVFTKGSGEFSNRRKQQVTKWFESEVEQQIIDHFYTNKAVKELLPIIEASVRDGEKIVSKAAAELFHLYFFSKDK